MGDPQGLSPQNIKLKAALAEIGAAPFYEKCLTQSDTGAHGRVVVPKAIAEAQFAEYLETQGATLSGEDIDGRQYDFRFRFWINNKSRMYLIEGCAELLRRYQLKEHDVIIFARKPDGTLVLAGRPAGPEDIAKRPAPRQRSSKSGEDKMVKPTKRRRDGVIIDGVFRACAGADTRRPVFHDGTCWACVIDIVGEVYRAQFDLEDDAWAALRAACPGDIADSAEAAAAAAGGGGEAGGYDPGALGAAHALMGAQGAMAGEAGGEGGPRGLFAGSAAPPAAAKAEVDPVLVG